MKTNDILKLQFVRFFAGNMAVALFVIFIPAVVIVWTVGAWADWVAILAILAAIHFGIIAVQIAVSGRWVPEKWNAVFFLPLPLIDAGQTVALYEQDLGGWFIALLLTTYAVYVAVHIIMNQWRRLREKPSESSDPVRRSPGAGGGALPAYEETPLTF